MLQISEGLKGDPGEIPSTLYPRSIFLPQGQTLFISCAHRYLLKVTHFHGMY